MPGATAQQVREPPRGWLVDYVVWDRPLTGPAPAGPGPARRDEAGRGPADRPGAGRVWRRRPLPHQARGFDRKHRRTATVLSSIRIKDGHVLDRLRIPRPRHGPGPADEVLRDPGPGRLRRPRLGASRVTTIKWRPASGKVTTLSRRTAHRTDGAGLGRVGRQEIVLPDQRKGQTVADLGTDRRLWRLPVSEHAVKFGHGVLLTMTEKAGPDDVRVLRAREARTGRCWRPTAAPSSTAPSDGRRHGRS